MEDGRNFHIGGHEHMLTKITDQPTKIEQLESFSQSIMRSLRSVIIVNQLINITEINRAAELTLGYTEKEENKTFFTLPPDGIH